MSKAEPQNLVACKGFMTVVHGLSLWGEVARKSGTQLGPAWNSKVQAGAPTPGLLLLLKPASRMAVSTEPCL